MSKAELKLWAAYLKYVDSKNEPIIEWNSGLQKWRKEVSDEQWKAHQEWEAIPRWKRWMYGDPLLAMGWHFRLTLIPTPMRLYSPSYEEFLTWQTKGCPPRIDTKRLKAGKK